MEHPSKCNHNPCALQRYRYKGGAYPGLDTGPFKSDIREPVRYNKSTKILLCGNSQPIDDIPTIRHSSKNWKSQFFLARDIEAYFLKWAFANNYYTFAVGFDGGALDLLTFLGIPTA
jgi:hypothetical protein